MVFFVEEFVGLSLFDSFSSHSPTGISEGLLRGGGRLLEILPGSVFIQGDRLASGGYGALLILNTRY